MGSIGLAERIVVETDVAAGDRNVERAAGFGDAVDRFAELPHDFGLFGIAEVQAIGGGHGARAGAGDVARGFGDGVHRADARIEAHQRPLPSVGKRERALAFPSRRTTAASPAPGTRSVLVRTM